MMRQRYLRAWIFTSVLYVACAAAILEAQTKKVPKPTSTTTSQDEGQRLFEANCSRCHAAPEGFSPRIAGTVVRHMRVRANLSHDDEQRLLRFFNP
jgi:cytochrome c5